MPGLSISRIASVALDCLLPPSCAHCGAGLEEARPGLCRRCLESIVPLPAGCRRCGLPRPGAPEECARCRAWPEGLVAVAATRYGGAAETLVHMIKYAGWRHLAEACAEPMAAALARARAAPETFVPVPLHAARQRARGFNQAHAIAAALALRAARPTAEPLVRRRPTRSQVGLGRVARVANVRGAFGATGPVRGKVGLVDDVATSGATLAAAGAALLEAGADAVVGVTFALALDPGPSGR